MKDLDCPQIADLNVPFVLLGSAAGKRVHLMQAALAAMGRPAAHVVEWRDWLAKPDVLDRYLSAPCVFKLEPPGEDIQAQHCLLQDGCRILQRPALAPLEHGQLIATDIWFAGFSAALQRLEQQLMQHSQVQVVNAPSELLLMTDKLACQQHLEAYKVATPPLLGAVQGYEHLCELLDRDQLNRVYLKARYGSSAAGVLAYRRTRDGREQATTSADLVRSAHGNRLYNVKRLRRYESQPDIACVIDLLAGQQAYAETWVSKARVGKGHFDVRVVTLSGQPAHRVARIGEHAMTNLHLDNKRGDLAALLDVADQEALEQTARQAAAAFPRSHVVGFDLVVRHGRAQVLEANGFGDLLPDLLWQGHDTYAAQLQKFSV